MFSLVKCIFARYFLMIYDIVEDVMYIIDEKKMAKNFQCPRSPPIALWGCP
jgi:hypothetical protein